MKHARFAHLSTYAISVGAPRRFRCACNETRTVCTSIHICDICRGASRGKLPVGNLLQDAPATHKTCFPGPKTCTPWISKGRRSAHNICDDVSRPADGTARLRGIFDNKKGVSASLSYFILTLMGGSISRNRGDPFAFCPVSRPIMQGVVIFSNYCYILS